MNLFEYIEQNTLRLEASHRGGGIEIDASEYLDAPGARMTAYQNYLGGGMLGAVANSYNREALAADDSKREELGAALARYYYNITNDIVEDWDEWAASADFEQHQATRPTSYPGL